MQLAIASEKSVRKEKDAVDGKSYLHGILFARML